MWIASVAFVAEDKDFKLSVVSLGFMTVTFILFNIGQTVSIISLSNT
jgi:hypothetical protein